MNKLDPDYQNLLKDILGNGIKKGDRTGVGTMSVFGRQIRHKMSDGFPLLTTKKMAWKQIVTELIWFLRGETNIQSLVKDGNYIWVGDAYKNYCNNRPSQYHGPYYTQEEFIKKIKTDDEFAEKWGELGPIYGKQWRGWSGKWKLTENDNNNFDKWRQNLDRNGIDQIANLINDLKSNPDSRRLMVNAWNVGELDQMTLPPCHYGFQVYTRKLSAKERWDWHGSGVHGNAIKLIGLIINENENENAHVHSWIDRHAPFVPKRSISLMWNQRSVDTFLGLPFNIASYGLLLEILAKEVNMVPDELIGNLGDTHLYSNHIDAAKEQIGRELSLEERFEIISKREGMVLEETKRIWSWNTDKETHDDMTYNSIPTLTRKPYPLPTLKMNPIFLANLEHKGLDEAIKGQVNFELENYQSHSTIKAPLNN
jgi:thymidylate synthase